MQDLGASGSRSHGYAYLATTNYLRVVDVLDSTAPTEAGIYDLLPGEGRDLALSGDYVYLAAGSAGPPIIDVADPQALHEVAAYKAVEQGFTSVDLYEASR